MRITRTMANKAEAAKGALKKLIGQSTGNTRLRTEGRVE